MQKIKSINWSGIINIIKCCLIGVASTIIGTVIFAIVLKFSNLSTNFISWINNIIKIFSIFIMMSCVKKKNNGNLLIKAILAGAVYAILCFLIFSILNGCFSVDISFVYNLIFSIIASVIISVIINILNCKS